MRALYTACIGLALTLTGPARAQELPSSDVAPSEQPPAAPASTDAAPSEPEAPAAAAGPPAAAAEADTAPASPAADVLSGSANEPDGRYRKYAAHIISKYDKNNDGVLEAAEWSTFKTAAANADADGDGKLTAEEYATFLAARTRPGAPSGPAPSAPPPPATEMRVFPLEYAQAEDVVRLIQQLLRVPNITADKRTNSIITRTEAPVLREIETLVRVLDVPIAEAEPAEPSVSTEALGKDFSGDVEYSDPSPQTVTAARRRYEQRERQARQLAKQIREASADPSEAQSRKDELRTAVQEAFHARQMLHRYELAQFVRRLERMHQSLNARERVAARIVNHRVEELLDPDLDWDALEAVEPSSLAKPSTVARPLLPVPAKGGSSNAAEYSQPGARHGILQEVPNETVLGAVTGARFQEAFDELSGTGMSGGLTITELQEGGPLEAAGLRVGDILVGVDRWQVTSLRDLNYVFQETNSRGSIEAVFVRGKKLLRARFKWAPLEPAGFPRLGSVQSRDDQQLVTISLGSGDGVETGDTLVVSTAGNQLGEVEVIQVHEDRSVARIVRESKEMPIRKGDQVLLNSSSPSAAPPFRASSIDRATSRRSRQDVQLALGPSTGFQLQWIEGPGTVMRTSAGVRIHAPFGSQLQFRLHGFPQQKDGNVFVTVQLVEAPVDTEGRLNRVLQHNAIPLALTSEEFEQVLIGNVVTKVVYLPHDLSQAGDTLFNQVVSTERKPGVDLRGEAEKRGSVLAVVTMRSSDEPPSAEPSER